MDAAARVAELRQQVEYHNVRYHQLDDPESRSNMTAGARADVDETLADLRGER